MILQTTDDLEREVKSNPSKVYEITSKEIRYLFAVWWTGRSFAVKKAFASGMPDYMTSLEHLGFGPFSVVKAREFVRSA